MKQLKVGDRIDTGAEIVTVTAIEDKTVSMEGATQKYEVPMTMVKNAFAAGDYTLVEDKES